MSAPAPVPEGGRVFLTGGTGLVGSHAAAVLRADGLRVRALHRPASRTGFLEALGCDLVEGDVGLGADGLGRAMEGCDALVHAAAAVYGELTWPRVRALNVEGARAAFEGAARRGIRRGVHVSSAAVYGKVRGSVDETASVETPLALRQLYARSKREAEVAVAAAAAEAGLAVAVLRPPVVYGERDRLFVPGLIRFLGRPVHPLPGCGRRPLAAVYAGNLGHAVAAGLRAPLEPGARPFNVAGDDPVSLARLLAALARGLGIPFRPVPVPGPLVLAGALLGDALGIRVPGASEISLARAARLAARGNPYRSGRAREELGWRPPISADRALVRTARWFAREAGVGDVSGDEEARDG